MLRTIYKNGNIYTFDKECTVVQAMLIENDKIKYIGSNEYIAQFEKEDDEQVDLDGKTVIPGFIDSHLHLLAYGKSLSQVNLSDCKSIKQVIDKCKLFIKENNITANQWLIGNGWNHESFEEKRMIDRYDIDEISKDIPIMLRRACLHVASCNTKALEKATITPYTKVNGGVCDVKDGKLSGILFENAVSLVENSIPAYTKDEKKQIIKNAMNMLSSYGITSVHTDDLAVDNGGLEMVDVYRELEEKDELNVRLTIQKRITSVEEIENYFATKNEFKEEDKSNDLKFNSIKLIGDGSLGGKTAAMFNSYVGTKEKGIALFTQQQMNKIVEIAHVHDVPVVIHAIGDKTIQMAIKSIYKAKNKFPNKKLRDGIVHCQITTERQLKQISSDNILAYIQPIFINSDAKIIYDRIKKQKVKYTYNWQTLLRSGTTLTLGTDSPVESPNPFDNIYAAVSRKYSEDENEVFLEDQKMSMYDTIKAYTINGAYASNDEEIKGSLEQGKLADFIILSEDILQSKEENIKNIKCLKTIKGGKVVYKVK